MSRVIRDGMAAGLAPVLASFGGVTRATRRIAPWQDPLPALVVSQPVDAFDAIFSGGGAPIYGQLGGSGGPQTPCSYVWWVLFALLDPDADQPAVDAADTTMDSVLEAIKGYLRSNDGQCTGSLTQLIRPVRIERSDEGDTILYSGQEFWGAKISLEVYETNVPGTL